VKYSEHKEAESFLAKARPALERQECVHGLMLGVCLRLVREPNAYGSQPYLATVESDAGLLVAAVMTPPYKLQIYSEDDREMTGLGLVADALWRGKWPVPGVMAREVTAEEFASIWRHRTGVSTRTGMRQGIYELRQVIHPQYPSGEFRQADPGDMELVRQWASGFHDDIFGKEHPERTIKSGEEAVKNGHLFLWVDGEPKSMAGRTRPTPHGEAISFVYTPPSQRRKGYATAVVAQLSQKILDYGRQFCTLYTDLGNPTSNRIYQRIGYQQIADVVDIHFESTNNDPKQL
jgi:predicted GNAT family acetyltransferase